MGVPSFAVRRYFLSQISSDASWKGTASMSFGLSFMTVFMNPWHSKYCAAYDGSRESARKNRADDCPTAVAKGCCQTAESPERPTPRAPIFIADATQDLVSGEEA